MIPDNDNGLSAIVGNSAPLRFLSACSGIEAASVAWSPLGWKAVAFGEIDKAASAVLAHHYPDVPNLGDFTTIDVTTLGRVDILCGGTPCQAFSVAGLRQSLQDARGNLTLQFVRLAHDLADGNGLRNAVWENVPGVLSTKDNAFGCFLAGLVGADDPIPSPTAGKWPDAGMVSGPRGRAAWRILDAQYFGLAQRRRRVLVVADFGNGADPCAILFERVGMQGNFAPSREKGEGVAAFAASSLGSFSKSEVSGPDRAAGGDVGGGSENLVFAPEIARCDATREGNSQEYESTTMVAHAIQAGALRTNPNSGPDGIGVQAGVAYTLEARAEVQAVCVTGAVTHTLKAEGSDASEDGTGRGTPIVAFDPRQTDVLVHGDITGPLDTGIPGPAICFTTKDYGGVAAVEIAPTLRSGNHAGSHQNGGVTPAVTVALRGREGGATAELGGSVTTALRASSGGGDKPHVLTSAVRRLTPRECERLQGFPDDYTRIPVRHYKAKKVTKNRPDDMWESDPNGGWWLMANGC